MTTWTDEYEPLGKMQELLDENWVEYIDVPKPTLQIVNDPDDAISRIDMWDNDYLLIAMPSPEQIRPRGNFVYHDRITQILLTTATRVSRQRMRNLYKEIRAICFMKKHVFPNWQLLRPISYRELYGTDQNIWRGEYLVQLENHAVLSETTI